MTVKNIFIQCRVSKQEKNDWKMFARAQKFPSISELIRYSVKNAIENELKRSDNWFFLNRDEKENRREYMRVRVPEVEKKEWDTYMKVNSFPSMSEVVRFSVGVLIETEMRHEIKRRDELYFIKRADRYYHEELNKLLSMPSCKKCGQTGVAWLSNDGLCLDCHNKQELEFWKTRNKNQMIAKNVLLELPEELINNINAELKINNILAYRTYTEFIIEATRRRLEEVQNLRLKAKTSSNS